MTSHHWAHGLVTELRTTGVLALLLFALCGAAYPSVTTAIAGVLFPWQATGSLVENEGMTVGSVLVGQPFVSDRYFHGRPSAAGYRPMAVVGSNLAPSNPELRARVRRAADAIARREGVARTAIPVDLLAASGSGIDPDISPAAAAIQVARVARARDLPSAAVEQVVARYTSPPTLGVFGEPRVNVLRLNLALDRVQSARGQ